MEIKLKTQAVPAYSEPCWKLFQLERGVVLTEQPRILLKEQLVKYSPPSYVLTPLGREYLQIVKNSELDEMNVSADLLEVLAPIFFRALSGTLTYQLPFVEDLITAQLLAYENQVSVTPKGLRFLFGYSNPNVLVSGICLYLGNPNEYNADAWIKEIPFDVWAILLTKLDSKKLYPKERELLNSIINKLG